MSGQSYDLCGWHVRSSLAVPEFTAWNGPADAPVDIVLREGEVPEAIDDRMIPGRYLMADVEGAVLVHISDLVRILLKPGGREIVVQRLAGEADQGWRLFLLGGALAYLCHQRGVLPFHAASIEIDGRVAAFAGERGSGKSTLAHALVRRGHRLLSDDLTVLRPLASHVELLPAFPRLRLWRASLEAAGIDPDSLARVRNGIEKYDLRPSFDVEPVLRRLDAVFLLRAGDTLSITPLSAVEAIPAIDQNVPRLRIAQLLGRRAAIFADVARVAAAVPVRRLIRPVRFDELPATVAAIEAALAA